MHPRHLPAILSRKSPTLVKKAFQGKQLDTIINQVVKDWEICLKRISQNAQLQLLAEKYQTAYHGKDWQPDFTHMPGSWHSQFLLVLVNTCRVQAYHTRSEKAREVIRVLINKIITWLGFSRSLQSNNGPAFHSGYSGYLQGSWHWLQIALHLKGTIRTGTMS